MKRVTRNRLIGGLLAGTLMVFGVVNAQAQSTASGTTISNTATVNYKVGGVAQTAINSNTSTFVVDDKLSLSVTKVDASIVDVSPGQTGTILVYKVTNNGNATQGVTFTALNEATGTTNPFTSQPNDDFDVSTPTVHVSKTNVATYDSTNDTASSIPQLAAGASQYVFVISDIPLAQVNGDSATVALIAQVAAKGASAGYGTAPGANITSDDSTAAWTPGTVQNIFADAAGTDDSQYDGKASDRDAVLVKSASLSVTKTASVVSDPTGSSTPHAIPGAVMMYTISAANAAGSGQSATSVEIQDDLSSQTNLDLTGTQASILVYNNGAATGVACGSVTTPVTCSFTSNKVDVSGLTADAGKTAKVTFTVKIK